MKKKLPRKKREIKVGEILDERDPAPAPRKYGDGSYGRQKSRRKNPGR